MRATPLVTIAAAAFLTHGVAAKEVRPNALTAQIYDSGSVHQELMAQKMVRLVYSSLCHETEQQALTSEIESATGHMGASDQKRRHGLDQVQEPRWGRCHPLQEWGCRSRSW